MARKLRIQYEGAIYHVMNRGDRREDIFHDDQDRQLFLKTLGEACEKTAWQIHAYCLMRNHFHLVVETPRANLVAGMKWFLGTYTARFNRRHEYFGHLFSGRYKSLIVDGSGNGYLRTVCDYVHLNPARAKLLKPAHQLCDYSWSSYPAYLKPRAERPKWLRVDRVLGEAGIPKASPAGRQEFGRRMELRRWEDQPEIWQQIRRGWALGSEEFREELLEAMNERDNSEYIAGDEIKETEQHKAARIIREELARLKWTVGNLQAALKGDRRKIRIAKRLRAETTMTLKWIAEQLHMGTWTHVANRIYHA
jgi:REP element-mobilizing transposase RayT